MAVVKIKPKSLNEWLVFVKAGERWRKTTTLPFLFALWLKQNCKDMSNRQCGRYIDSHRCDLIKRETFYQSIK